MKALIWKEFRENRLWLILMALISTSVMGAVIASSIDHDPRPNGFRFDGMLTVAFLTIPAAFLMGIAQTLFEIRRDQWAYLTQRAVTKSQIFLSKVIVGLGVCLVVAILPIAMMVVWSWQADRISFDLADVLFLFSPFLASITFYFTAILIVCGSSRWYISRLFVIVWPILSFIVWLIFFEEFSRSLTWPIFIWLMFSACVMAIAAWGAFTGGERNKRLQRAARISWASVLFVAFQVGLIIIYGFSLSGYEEYQKANHGSQLVISSTATDYRIDKQGHVIQLDYRIDLDFTKTGDRRRMVHTTKITDIDDPTSEKYRNLDGPALDTYHWNGAHSTFLAITPLQLHPRQSRRLNRDLFVEGSRIVYKEQQAQWVYSKSRGLFYLFLINRRDGKGKRLPAKLEKIIGPDGFVLPGEPLPDKRFGRLLKSSRSSDSSWPQHWQARNEGKLNRELFVFDDGVYVISLANSEVRKFYTPPAGKKVCDVVTNQISHRVLVLLDDEIHVYVPFQLRHIVQTKKDQVVEKEEDQEEIDFIVGDWDSSQESDPEQTIGKFEKKFSIPPSAAVLGRFSFGEVEETGELIFVAGGDPMSGLTADLIRIVKVAADGTVNSQRDFVTTPLFSHSDEQFNLGCVAAMTPVAAVVAVTGVGSVLQRSSGIGPGIIERQLSRHPKFWATPLGILLGVGFVFAFIAYRRARRRNLSQKQKWCWAAIGFFFGPAGVLTLACMNRIAARVTCNNCGSATAVDELNCFHCGSQAVVAPARGIEIFDPKLTSLVS